MITEVSAWVHGKGEIKLTGLKPLTLIGGMPRVVNDVLRQIDGSPIGMELTRKILVKDNDFGQGIHYTALDKYVRSCINIAILNNMPWLWACQSYEYIRRAHEVALQLPDYPLAYIRIEHAKDKLWSIEYDRDTLQAAFDIGAEIR